MILKNYHTHTYRCHHAYGSDREYVENAIKAGIKTLGISDHTPYYFDNDYISFFRMDFSQFDGYVKSVLSLKEEYKNEINIILGLEAEFYPKHFNRFLNFLKDTEIEYLILGQHHVNNEFDGVYSGAYRITENEFIRYVEQIIEGINTGYFSYIAHPDLINFSLNESLYYKYMKQMCQEAKRLNIPLEFNMNGYVRKSHYPSKRFFEIAKEVGNTIIFGYDAHQPEFFQTSKNHIDSAEEFINGLGLKVTDTIKLLNGKLV